MKKTLISLAVLAATASVAQAQSNVTIYGILDAGIVSEHGGVNGATNKVTSGVGSNSRIGFKGTEDLGNGLSAVFLLEAGYNTDTGTSSTSGSLFNRQAYVGLKSQTLGGVTLGRQYTPFYNTLVQVADPFAGGYAGSIKNLFSAVGTNTRTSNTILYSSPSYYGFQGDVAYSAGESTDNNVTGRQMGASLGYANGPLVVRAAYNVRDNNATNSSTGFIVDDSTGRNALIAANYDFQVVKAYLAYAQDKGLNSALLPNATAYSSVAAVASTDSREFLIGATVPVGPAGTVMVSYIKKDDKDAANQDANQWGIGYSYNLSKRTSAYLAYARIDNKNGASYTVGNNNEVGTGSSAYNIGLRHSF
jgi:GBP family porin